MQRKFLRLPAFVLCAFLAFSPPSHALAPLAVIPSWYFVTSAVLHVAAAAAGLYYAMLPDRPATSSSDGSVSRPSSVAWIDLSTGKADLNEVSVTAQISHDNLKGVITANPTKYPNLKNALEYAVPPVDDTTKLGDVIRYNGQNYEVTRITGFSSGCVGTPGFQVIGGKLYYADQRGGYSGGVCQPGSQYRSVEFDAVSKPVSKPSTRPATPSEFASQISGGSGPVKPLYQQEIDKAFQDPNYVPVFTDDTTGLPFENPPQYRVATPSQVDAYNNKIQAQQAASDAAAASVASAQARSSAAGAAVDSARNAVTVAQGNYNTDPSAGNAQILADAQRALARAESDKADADAKLSEVDAKQKQQESDDLTLGDSGFSSDPYGDGSNFDLGVRFNQFVVDMKATSLFSLPNQFFSGIPSGGDPSVSFDGGRFGHHTFDFSTLFSAFTVLRSVVFICFGWLSIRIVALKGGGG
ncbi:hypothetical protein [Trichlorobacter ammonificans]|uniref:Uncharacterized protein n=1 Tax=Trichlorobacter ammonificans TaxID=2916410 RepID=A0ABN8HGZ4_9BACT|nr:hypothetical protein [Trichlorobacter ammonificans]CAH2032104.1 conserved membrane protein of unknown function [Trichlorobacter ammonificans]